MRQAISTKYHGPTNSRGGRVKATARKREVYSDHASPEMALTDYWNHAEGIEANHSRVAKLLAAKLGWSGLWIGGGSPENSGYVYVNAAEAYEGAPDSGIGREDVDWFYIAPAPRS